MRHFVKKEFVFGFHALEALLKKHPERILQLYRQEGRADKRILDIIQLAEYQQIPILSITKVKCDQYADYAPHQGILAQIKMTDQLGERDLFNLLAKKQCAASGSIASNKPAFFLLLDEVQDPHNLGACLRSANAAGVDAVVITQDRSVGMTPIVRKIAAGAAEMTPLISVTNLANTLRQLKKAGVWLYGLDASATQCIYNTQLTGPLGLLLGAEAKGLRRLTKELCDGLMAIPMAGSVSSLNVSVAAGICLFEALRQRQ
jgi:23S rRNA (guanosine2251-2'-O)-methyltransferase